MPANALYVGRPTGYGNPFVASDERGTVHLDNGLVAHLSAPLTPAAAVFFYRFARMPWSMQEHELSLARYWLGTLGLEEYPEFLAFDRSMIDRLRGLDLVCWCDLDVICHADLLIEMANRERDHDAT